MINGHCLKCYVFRDKTPKIGRCRHNRFLDRELDTISCFWFCDKEQRKKVEEMKKKIKLVELKQTCSACPSQWEGRTENNEPVYIRYRYGYLSVKIGEKDCDIVDAVHGKKEAFGKQLGDRMDGVLSETEMLKETGLIKV